MKVFLREPLVHFLALGALLFLFFGWIILLATVVILAALAPAAQAHESRPGFLELRETSPETYSFLWKKPTGGEVEIPLALLLFNVGVEIAQIAFVVLIVLLERTFRKLEIRWPPWVQALPGYAVGSLGACWTIQRVALVLGGAR
jgi:hypothetical protein